jgi:hydroxymethylbilane synthase
MRTLVAGTRRSELALTQTHWVIERLKELEPGLDIRVEKIVTKGDRILNVTLSKVGGKGLFVKEIEQALLDGKIDFAVHSMKDMPSEMPPGLVIGAVPVRETPTDALLSIDGKTLDELPSGAVVGTSSLRRQAQILAYRPDLKVKPVRGNLETRIRKMQEGQFDAIILATSGLKRMDWENKICQELTADVMLPAVGQGALAVQCRADDEELLAVLQRLNHEETKKAVSAERSFLHAFQGGCHLPIAAHAVLNQDEIYLTGLVADPGGQAVIKKSIRGKDPEKIGKDLAACLKEEGAGRLLETVREGLKI